MLEGYDILDVLYGIQKVYPKFSVLEYSEAGELIYEDYSCLNEYLEKKFIPIYLKKKYFYDKKIKDDNFKYYIYLVNITDLGLCREEFYYVMDYLYRFDIQVIGSEIMLCGEFDNYEYSANRRKEVASLDYLGKSATKGTFLENEQLVSEMLDLYFENRSIELRQKLVQLNLNLVKKIVGLYKNSSGLSERELIGYGCEGLIYAIEKYDPSHNNEFSTFACHCIKGYVLKGIDKCNSMGQSNFYFSYLSYKKKMEEEGQCFILESYDKIIDCILDEMIRDGKISKMSKPFYRILIFFSDPELWITEVDCLEIDSGYSMDDVDNLMVQRNLKRDLNKELLCLDDMDRRIIEKRFGLNGETYWTLAQLAKEYNVSHEAIRLREKRTLTKLRTKKLREYLEDL